NSLPSARPLKLGRANCTRASNWAGRRPAHVGPVCDWPNTANEVEPTPNPLPGARPLLTRTRGLHTRTELGRSQTGPTWASLRLAQYGGRVRTNPQSAPRPRTAATPQARAAPTPPAGAHCAHHT